MYGRKKEDTKVVIVKTKEELKAAIKRKDTNIEVQGELARKMKWMTKVPTQKVDAFIKALSTELFNTTSSRSYAIVNNFVGGADSTTIIAISLIGVLGSAAIYAIYKGYDVEVEVGGNTVKLTKK